MVYTQKFFHLPALYVYLLAAVLLVTSVFHAAGFVRQGLYLLLDLNDSVRPVKFSSDLVTFTPAAEAYLDDLAAEQTRRTNTAGLIRSLILLVVSLGSFAWFWKRTGRSQQLDMELTVRNFYFFLVSGIAFLILFYSLSAGVASLVQQAVNVEWTYFPYDVHRFHGPRPEGQQQPRTVDVDEVRRNLETQRKEAEAHRTSQNRQVVDQLTVSFVALPVFWLHDRRFGF
ncbi:MAG: hypothetical protein DDT37_01373 [Firmicutes bacterium]|nr:hypothetical protein [candidate division NPL-UPA2 bacterium]